uniref:Uncharacterized protein n=2 Tax=Bombyx mori TaxID=7091 RepID=A0A8R2QYU4_BOMMO|nr:uncharacterized protein LOC105842243 [Bombyx mori]
MQTIFAVITVTSFILIVLMAIHNSSLFPVGRPAINSRCQIQNCRVVCRDVTYLVDYGDLIVSAVAEAETRCSRIILVIKNFIFRNATMPENWLSNIRSNIQEIAIIRGNLMRIPADAFRSHFARNISTIILQSLTLRAWEDGSLVGLANLDKLYIRDCNIIDIQPRVLSDVAHSLQTLTITQSGFWHPNTITGKENLPKLGIVDFSFNHFKDVLNSNSFIGLGNCRVLYLNYCKITSIGPNTFDRLLSIEYIYLNNNYLVTLPTQLFDSILQVRPNMRVNLQNNHWYCSCTNKDLMSLTRSDVLTGDPICDHPYEIRGVTFSEFYESCPGLEEVRSYDMTYSNSSVVHYTVAYVNGSCYDDTNTPNNISLRIINSSANGPTCFSNVFKDFSYFNSNPINVIRNENKNDWLKLTFFVKSEQYSIVEIDSSRVTGYGLLWFQSTCPNEAYCLNVLPNFLRVYNINFTARYTFCPIQINNAAVEVEDCLTYDLSTYAIETRHDEVQILFYALTGVICLIFGALCVYAMIRKNPILLKGSKRILFVKHKTVDALVLPPKISLRDCHRPVEQHNQTFNDKIFTVCSTECNKYDTLRSYRSSISSTPSYVSALEPTEDQLANWRIAHHFNDDLSVSSNSSLATGLSSDSLCYYSLDSV